MTKRNLLQIQFENKKSRNDIDDVTCKVFIIYIVGYDSFYLLKLLILGTS